MTQQFWQGKKVFLTGHTGFKGSWLTLWLHRLGAEVHGYALAPASGPSLFTTAKLDASLASSTIGDIRDAAALERALQRSSAEVVFHLAAQPLVRQSYLSPVDTFAINVMGTVNLLEAVRRSPHVQAVVNVTTDKCYENREWVWPYREDEAMGGHDPYSSSKACSELVSASYRRAFLAEAGVALATARAGNVIGGGDWSPDRLIPDFLRALDQGQTLTIRSPFAIRPWQHVLEPLAGYMQLAEHLCQHGQEFAQAWNFGPADEDARDVAWIVNHLVSAFPGTSWQLDSNPQPHEAQYLKLDSSKARTQLGWQPRWKLGEALEKITSWHTAWRTGEPMRDVCLAQIAAYEAAGTDRQS